MVYGGHYDRLVLYFDGASKNNPHGPAGCGWVLYTLDVHGTLGHRIAHGRENLGFNISNNQAEYMGIECGLRYLLDNYISCNKLFIRGDSEIVLKQLDGQYKVRSNNIVAYYNDVQELINQLDMVTTFKHVPRSKNWEADRLAREGIIYGDDTWDS